MSKKFHIVYKTVNLHNGLYYIGVHSTNNINDGYIGSGLLLEKAIKKHGKENFRREIIKMCKSRKDAYQLESELVTEELIKSRKVYNRAVGGNGGYLGQEAIEKMKKSKLGIKPWNTNKRLKNEHKQKISKSLTGRKNPEHSKRMTGRRYSKEVNKKKGLSGIKNPAWKGYYITPLGTFETAKEAAESHGFSPQTLKRRIESKKHSEFKFKKIK